MEKRKKKKVGGLVMRRGGEEAGGGRVRVMRMSREGTTAAEREGGGVEGERFLL